MLTEFAFLFLLRKAVEGVNCDPNDEIMTHLLYGEHSSCEKPCIKFSHPLNYGVGREVQLFLASFYAERRFCNFPGVGRWFCDGRVALEKMHGVVSGAHRQRCLDRQDPACQSWPNSRAVRTSSYAPPDSDCHIAKHGELRQA